jgi:hypothetical protein
MTNSNHDETIRFRHSPDSQLGKVLEYMRLQGYDLKKEAEYLLIARFLPFALKEEIETLEDLQAAKNMAFDCIGKLTGFIYSIREAYQLPSLADSLTQGTNSIPVAKEEPELKDHPIEDDFRSYMFGGS